MPSLSTLRRKIREVREDVEKTTHRDGTVFFWVDEGETEEEVVKRREKELGRKLNAEKIIFISWQSSKED